MFRFTALALGVSLRSACSGNVGSLPRARLERKLGAAAML
jgi:hypothetical protein